MRIAILALVVVSGCIPPDTRTPLRRGPQDQYEAAIAIEAACVMGDPFTGEGTFLLNGGRGTGVIISNRQALTALHVVMCPHLQGVWVRFANGERMRAVVSKWDEEADVALLTIATAETWPVSVHPPFLGRPDLGDAVCAATAVPRRGWSCGSIEVLRRGNGKAFYMSAGGEPGNSGSGVYNSDGHLVGILTHITTDDHRFAIAARIPTGVLP